MKCSLLNMIAEVLFLGSSEFLVVLAVVSGIFGISQCSLRSGDMSLPGFAIAS